MAQWRDYQSDGSYGWTRWTNCARVEVPFCLRAQVNGMALIQALRQQRNVVAWPTCQWSLFLFAGLRNCIAFDMLCRLLSLNEKEKCPKLTF